MSLLQRMERAQQAIKASEAAAAAPPGTEAADTESRAAQPADVALVEARTVSPVVTDKSRPLAPVPMAHPVHSALRPAPAPAREDLIREVRLRLQSEVVGAFTTLLDAKETEVQGKIDGLVDRVIGQGGFAVTREERSRLVERDGPRRHRLRAARAAARRPEHHRGDGQRPEPHLHRARRQDRADRQRLPQRRARPPRHRPDHRPARPADRREQPAGRCPTARRLARQRHHRAAVAGRSGHHGPQVRPDAVHRRRPHQVRDGHARRCSTSSTRASRRGSTCSCPVAPGPARPRRSTSCRRSSRTTSGS